MKSFTKCIGNISINPYANISFKLLILSRVLDPHNMHWTKLNTISTGKKIDAVKWSILQWPSQAHPLSTPMDAWEVHHPWHQSLKSTVERTISSWLPDNIPIHFCNPPRCIPPGTPNITRQSASYTSVH